MTRTPPPLATALLLALPGCSHIGAWRDVEAVLAIVQEERIVVSPGLLNFGDVSVIAQGSVNRTFTVTNLGDAAVAITGQDEPTGSVRFATDADPVLVISPGQSIDIAVTFTPTTEEDARADLFIEPTGELLVLTGRGRAPVAMVANPELPAAVVGCTGQVRVPVTNGGSEDLLLAARAPAGEYAVVSAPQRIAPGATDAIVLDFTPSIAGQRGGLLELQTNDPMQGEISVHLSAAGVEGNTNTEEFVYTPGNATDYLFLVEADDETADDLERGAAAIPAFVVGARAANVDYHVAILTGASSCPITEIPYATRWDSAAAATSLLLSGLSGGSGEWDQDLLGLAISSLGHVTQQACFDDFRREDAELHLIVVADGPADADVENQLARLQGIVGDPSRLRLSALVPGSTACGVSSADYAAAAAATGGVTGDLCDEDWTTSLTNIASVSEQFPGVRFPLSDLPLVDTLAVNIDDVAWTDWYYDPLANDVVVAGSARPDLGAEVVIRYVSSGVCGW